MSGFAHLKELFEQRKITRRQFIAQASALGFAAAISPALLPGKAMAATPEKGGHFVLGCSGGSTTDSMDPGTLTSVFNQHLNFQIRNCLVEIDHNFDPIPELAESWESTPDAKVWTFNLR